VRRWEKGYPKVKEKLLMSAERTRERLAVAKREATATAFKRMYPRTKQTRSRSEYDGTANARGREAGKRVGLHLGLEEK
jgi:hypothetical protein